MSTAPRSFNRNDLPNAYRSSGSDSPRPSGLSGTDAIDGPRRFTLWMGVIAMCCVVAIGISGYLTWASMTSSKIAGCGSGSLFDCSHVTNSKWSTFAGMPVSVLAIGSYLSLATALLMAVFQTSIAVKRLAWTAVLTFALSAALAAIWFVGLQWLVLEHFCQYCLVAHACGIIAAVVAIWKVPNSFTLLKISAPIAMTGIAILVTGQIYQPEPQKFRIETFEPAPASIETFDAPFAAPTEDSQNEIFEAPVVSRFQSNLRHALATQPAIANLLSNWITPDRIAVAVRPVMAMIAVTSPLQSNAKVVAEKKGSAQKSQRRTVGINGGAIKLDVTQWPLNGSVDAKHIYVEMLDYNCPNCRKTHQAINGAKTLLGDDVAVLILPIPLNTSCNTAVTKTDPKFIESCDIAKLAIAVWRVAPNAFGQFHDAMFAGAEPYTLSQANALAQTMVDPGKLQTELASGIPEKYIASMVQLYQRTGKGGVPKLLFPGTTIVGEFSSSQSLADVIRQQTK